MRTGYVVSPESILQRAVACGLLSVHEALSTKVQDAAKAEAIDLAASWPEGEGFGSSDMTGVMEATLLSAGIAVEYRSGRLCRKDGGK